MCGAGGGEEDSEAGRVGRMAAQMDQLRVEYGRAAQVCLAGCFSPPLRAVLPFVKLCGAPRPLAQIVEVGLADFSPQLQAVTQTHIHGSPFCTRRELRLATTHPRDTPSTLGRLLLLLLVLIHPHPHLHLHF